MESDKKDIITGISEDAFMKILNPEQAFKRSNWIEWLENEKSKRNHEKWILGYSVFTICILTAAFLYAGQINLINKETMSVLLGTVVGSGLSIFIKFKGNNKDT